MYSLKYIDGSAVDSEYAKSIAQVVSSAAEASEVFGDDALEDFSRANDSENSMHFVFSFGKTVLGEVQIIGNGGLAEKLDEAKSKLVAAWMATEKDSVFLKSNMLYSSMCQFEVFNAS